ncbi:MAG: PEP-CTERM sorting domain-containing protein, partial [Puniceicoccales bacterium]
DGSYLDSKGNPIIDNYPTSGSGGLDLRAIGYAYAVPEPRHYAMLAGALALVFAWLRRRTR